MSVRVLGLVVLPVPEAFLIFNADLHFGMHMLRRYYQSAQVISMYSPGAFVITQFTSSFCRMLAPLGPASTTTTGGEMGEKNVACIPLGMTATRISSI